MGPQLPPLSDSQLDMLLGALDPQLEGFGGSGCWGDDARAFLSRLGEGGDPDPTLRVWLEAWEQAAGNRETLRLALTALLHQRQAG
jgi:hypothetical protein